MMDSLGVGNCFILKRKSVVIHLIRVIRVPIKNLSKH